MIDIKQLEDVVNTFKSTAQQPPGIGKIGRDAPTNLQDLHKNGISPFKEILDQENTRINGNELKFSNHAITRLHSRNINITQGEKSKIIDGVNELREKGAKDALIMLKDLSMIVSVDNKTVVTVMDTNEPGSGNNIYTNIDSAMMIK